MGKQVTFGVEVANALLRSGVNVIDMSCIPGVLISVSKSVNALYGPWGIPEGTTLTSEQVTAAVQADPGKLAARFRENLYRWNGAWERWLARASESDKTLGWRPNPVCAPDLDRHCGWELVLRPDLKAEPEEPPRPAQGTTLRAIMEWCARTNTTVKCRRPNADLACSAGEIRISAWVSTYDLHEASDWQASTDDGKTWFVPGQIEQREESGPKETVSLDFMREPKLPRTTRVLSEAVRHAETGGVTECKNEFFRVRDGYWECHRPGGDSWNAEGGEWVLTTGAEYTLHPVDYLDDATKAEDRETETLLSDVEALAAALEGKCIQRRNADNPNYHGNPRLYVDGKWQKWRGIARRWDDHKEPRWLCTLWSVCEEPTAVEPREGPELWAWMCRTGRVVIDRLGKLLRVAKDGRVEMAASPEDSWKAWSWMPLGPCTPVEGDWDDEVDHA